MTPEKATKILDLTDEVREYRDFVGDVKCWTDPVDGDVLEGTKCAITAADYSMEMLEQISRMTWEYAVQLDFGTYVAFYVRPGIRTRYPHAAHWTDDRREHEAIRATCETYYGVPATIVRRMVAAPQEVTE